MTIEEKKQRLTELFAAWKQLMQQGKVLQAKEAADQHTALAREIEREQRPIHQR